MIGDGTHVSSLYREFLSLPNVTALSLGGSAITPSFLTGLFSECSKAPEPRDAPNSAEGMRLRSLTLHGLNLGRFCWFALLREPTHSGFGRWQLRVSSAISMPPFTGSPIHVNPRPPLLVGLTALRLVDCVNAGHLLPYLSLLPQLESLRLDSSAAPYWDARVCAQSSLQPVRVLDFLSLADCAALTALHCDYPIRPEVDQLDPQHTSGDSEAADEMHNQRRLRKGGEAAKNAKLVGVANPFADLNITLHPRVHRLLRDRAETLKAMAGQATVEQSDTDTTAASASPPALDRLKID